MKKITEQKLIQDFFGDLSKDINIQIPQQIENELYIQKEYAKDGIMFGELYGYYD